MGKFDSYTENTNPPGTATILADTGVNTERVPIGVLTSWKKPARIATEVDDTLSGLAARDGITPVAGDRVLVKAQSTASANGIYDAAAGSWVRSTDFDTDAKAIANILIPIEEGTVNADKVFQLTTNNPITIGTTSLVFAEFGVGGVGGKTFAALTKPIDEVVNNDATLQDDDDLFFSANANKSYGYFLCMIHDATSDADMKYAFSLPSGASGEKHNGNLSASGTPTTDITASFVITGGGIGVIRIGVSVGRIVIAGTAGNVNLQWAQNSARVSDATMRKGSYLLVWEET